MSATNCTVWYLHTVSFNHYNLLYTTILFYSCVLFHLHSLVSHKQLPSCLHSSIKEHSVIPCVPFPLFSFFHTKTVSFLFTLSNTHAFCSDMHSTFALQSISPIQSTPSIQSNTNSAVWYLHTVSFNHYNLLHTHILFYSCVLFHLYSLVSHKQLPSCLHSSIKEHSVLPMRSIPSIQSFPHKNSQFLVYTQLHTRILFCPCVNFRFAFHAVKYSRLHLYCQLQTVQSGTYIQSVSIITTCFTHTFCSTHAFYSLYSVFSTQKQSVSCLHTVTHTHFVLPMR